MRNRLFVPEHKNDSLFFAFHQLKVFTRFEQFPEMLLFAKINSQELFIRNALDFFCYRFPPFVLALYNEPEKQLYLQSRRKDFSTTKTKKLGFDSPERALEWLRPVVQQQVKQRMEFSVEWKPEFFETFFDSQFVESRRNPRLQKQLMRPFLPPKDSVEFRSFKRFKHTRPNTRLSEFFFDKTPAENPKTAIVENKTGFKPKNAE